MATQKGYMATWINKSEQRHDMNKLFTHQSLVELWHRGWCWYMTVTLRGAGWISVWFYKCYIYMSFLTSVCSLNLMRLLLLHIFQRVTVVCQGRGVRALCLGISSCRLCNKQYEALFSMYLMHQFLIHLWVRIFKFWLEFWVPCHPIK